MMATKDLHRIKFKNKIGLHELIVRVVDEYGHLTIVKIPGINKELAVKKESIHEMEVV